MTTHPEKTGKRGYQEHPDKRLEIVSFFHPEKTGKRRYQEHPDKKLEIASFFVSRKDWRKGVPVRVCLY